ncbi:t-SNARE [Kickxella alabastrina]|uniref:t-SNARE n=1 Tax=Kickxella alabastrina TaxID=61397 RepID=UPI00221EC543|nr:t-SNARE [Kickxella alabastrina]KAI7827215.1 t-SNARE [Kickxella alabastrina]
MSFNDLERGTYAAVVSQQSSSTANNNLSGSQSDEERTYKRTVQELSRKVFQVNANVANIRRLVGQLGSKQDSSRLRQDIHSKMEATRDLVKTTSSELKSLSEYQNSNPSRRRDRRLEQQKLTGDFQKVLEQFQSIQRVSAEITREFVDRAKHAVQAQNEYGDDYDEYTESNPLLGNHNNSNRQQQQQQLLQHRQVELSVLDNDIEFNTAIINEREAEITEIEQGIVELNEIFRDLGTIVTEQQSLLDNIETNVYNVHSDVQIASEELHSASEYQRRSNKTKCCIMLFVVVFFVVILLMILS